MALDGKRENRDGKPDFVLTSRFTLMHLGSSHCPRLVWLIVDFITQGIGCHHTEAVLSYIENRGNTLALAILFQRAIARTWCDNAQE